MTQVQETDKPEVSDSLMNEKGGESDMNKKQTETWANQVEFIMACLGYSVGKWKLKYVICIPQFYSYVLKMPEN